MYVCMYVCVLAPKAVVMPPTNKCLFLSMLKINNPMPVCR